MLLKRLLPAKLTFLFLLVLNSSPALAQFGTLTATPTPTRTATPTPTLATSPLTGGATGAATTPAAGNALFTIAIFAIALTFIFLGIFAWRKRLTSQLI